MKQIDTKKLEAIKDRYRNLPASQTKEDIASLLEMLGEFVPRGTRERKIRFQVWVLHPDTMESVAVEVTAPSRPAAKTQVQALYPNSVVGKITLARSKPLYNFGE